jgi:hypothetical protein
MEFTRQQKERLAQLKDIYGRNYVKEHAPDPSTGLMRVELFCIAGTHNWYYDTDGYFTNGALTLRLFEPDAPSHKPRNAIFD